MKAYSYMNIKKSPKKNCEFISIVLPCRNEEKSLAQCISLIKEALKQNNLHGEIIVSDSSSDNSPRIAQAQNVILHKHDKQGYGVALLEGFSRVQGNYIFFADPDGTYNFNEIPRFIKYLHDGYDFVIGDRFKGGIKKDAMPWLHRHIGNPFLSFALRVFFNMKVHDVHCGMRALTVDALNRMNLQTSGMEFASEMVIKAGKISLKIKELPIIYYPRHGESKLKTFSDGWRHLRFMLLYSPIYLFFIPGILILLLGIASMLWFYFSTPVVFGITLFFHPMFISALLTITGYQLIVFALFACTYAVTHFGEQNDKLQIFYKYFTLEKGAVLGLLLSAIGILIFSGITYNWVKNDFGTLNEIKNFIIALTLTIIGFQTVFSSFMLSILSIKEK